MLLSILKLYNKVVNNLRNYDFLALLAIRIFLVPVIYVGAHSKVTGFAGSVQLMSDLGLPFPTALAFIAASVEVCGCIFITLGLFTRIISIPMIFLMSVASLTVHWKHGWDAIATSSMESTWRLNSFIEWLSVNFPGRYNYITELGDPVILNNGMEFAVTYFVMLSVLFFFGGGRYVSADYWLKKSINKKLSSQ